MHAPAQGFVEPVRRHDWRTIAPIAQPLSIVVSPAASDRASPPAEEGEAEEEEEEEPSSSRQQSSPVETKDAARIQHAKMQGVIYVTGRSNIRARQNSSWLRRCAPDITSVLKVWHPSSGSSSCTESLPEKAYMLDCRAGEYFAMTASDATRHCGQIVSAKTWCRFLLEGVFVFLHNNFQGWAMAQKIPMDRLIEVGMAVEL